MKLLIFFGRINCKRKIKGKLGHMVQIDVRLNLSNVFDRDNLLDDFRWEKCIGYRENS